MTEREETPSLEQLQIIHRNLLQGAFMVERQLQHLRRQRAVLAWGSLALAGASTAALFMSESVVQATLGGLQVALWISITVLNFGGPTITEFLAKLFARK